MIQKSGAAIFEILIFRDFSGGQSPNMTDLDQNLDFDPLKKSVFPYIWQYPLHVNGHKIKSNDNWVKYDPILEKRKIGLL